MKSLSIVSFLLLCTIVIHHHVKVQGVEDSGKKKYCVPKQMTSPPKMADYQKQACATPGVDCKALEAGGSCADKCPRTRAGYAATQNYRVSNQCDWSGTFELVEEDPSKGECKYP